MNLTNINKIKALLAEYGFRFSKSMGQNFLIAPWVPERIAGEAGLTEEDGVLEIGPGIGALTVELCERAGKVLSVELDERLEPILRVTLAGRENSAVVFGDALKSDLPALCREHLGERPWKVCANLPYNVTTPLLTAFLESGCFESITVMIQKEVAERICAAPGTGEYGSFTVLVNWYAQPSRLFDVTPDCFLPQPKVTSTVIRLARRKEPPARVDDEKFFFRVVRAAFNQRRKALPNALAAGLPTLEREQVRGALTRLGLPADIRGERLSVEQFAQLSNELLAR